LPDCVDAQFFSLTFLGVARLLRLQSGAVASDDANRGEMPRTSAQMRSTETGALYRNRCALPNLKMGENKLPRWLLHLPVLLLLLAAASASLAQQSYTGFDRNDYPGDAALPALRQNFVYTSYWLNNPPGETRNTWVGKRATLKQYGFGFLVLFNGRTDAQLRHQHAAAAGAADGKAAVALAVHEGFPPHVLIFLDQEEGGRLLPQQAAYLFAWIDAVRAAGGRAGVYCSGIPVDDGGSTTINTAQDIVQRLAARGSSKQMTPEVTLWIADDRCPPSPGCALPSPPMAAVLSPLLRPFTTVWQYVQSPRRAEFSAACPANIAPNGNCYAPGLKRGVNAFVDLNAASSPDPSETP
jgi:hypothetical protein